MQNNAMNNYQCYPQQNPNAVSINIYSPQAYGCANATNPVCPAPPVNNYYPIYGPNSQPNLPLYPANYNNLIERPQEQPKNLVADNKANKIGDAASVNQIVEENSSVNKTEEENKADEKKKNEKTITPLDDEYIKTLENYLNDANPKVRLIGAKELLERLKEDENRKDNPSLIPLVNKILQDSSPAVKFLGLTILQLDYCTGDDETVQLLKQIQQENKDKIGEEQLLASEILLKMTAPDKIKVKEAKE